VINAYVKLADLNEPRGAEEGDEQRPLAVGTTALGKLSQQTLEQVSLCFVFWLGLSLLE